MESGCAVAAVAIEPPADDRGWLLVVVMCECVIVLVIRVLRTAVLTNGDLISSVRPHMCCVLVGWRHMVGQALVRGEQVHAAIALQ